MNLIPGAAWYGVKDGDAGIRDMKNRHYSRRVYRDGRRIVLSCGPGEKMLLKTPDGLAAFIWLKFKDASGQTGISCAMFRNEGSALSSDLIREACALAWGRWPGERLYTYVNPRRIKSTNPGYCFIKAGWRACGKTKGGLIVLECLPFSAPERGHAE